MKLQLLRKITTGLIVSTMIVSSSAILVADKAEAHKITWCGTTQTRGRVERFVFKGRKRIRPGVYRHRVQVQRRKGFSDEWRNHHIDKVECTYTT